MMSPEDAFMFLDSSILLRSVKKSGKNVHVHPINKERQQFGEYHHLFCELKKDPCRFHEYTRMSMDTFQYILTKIEHRLLKNWCSLHDPIQPEERLVITLRYLATGTSFRSLAFSFRMGKTTVAEIIHETVVALWEELQPLHMPVPNEEKLRSVAEDFFSIWNFPNCVGAIDGKHVPIRCPNKSGSMFFNYKKLFSVILQGVADARYRFINIDVGGYGKQSDGGTFQASELYRALTEGKVNLPRPSALPQTNVMAPHVLIGDEAYPLLPFVLKPYSGTNLPVEKECFNKRLSRSRKTIECAFGLLTSKWRVLAKGIETRVDLVDAIVKSVCILHNTVIDRDGFQQNLTEVSVKSIFWQHSGRPTNEAKSIRDIFTTYFAHNPLTYE